MPTIAGTSGSDILTGTETADIVTGEAGADLIRGLGGNDILNGGDEVGTSSGYGDGIDGGDGDDEINGGAGNDVLMGGAGRDMIRGGAGADRITGGGGSVTSTMANALIDGTIQPTLLHGLVDPMTDDDAIDTLLGGEGDDVIYAGRGDTADGGEGADTLWISFRRSTSGLSLDLSSGAAGVLAMAAGGSFSNFEFFGVAGSDFGDTIIGTSGNDSINGFAGDDTLRGGAGNDGMAGGDGADQLDGGDGNDTLDGGAGRDSFIGGAGNDSVTTSEAFGVLLTDVNGRRVTGAALDDGEVDTVDLGAGDDTAYLGFGDIASGGEGSDTVHVSLARRASGVSLDLRGPDAMALLNQAVGGSLSGFEVIGNNIVLTGFDDVLWVARSGNFYGLAGNDRIIGNAEVQFMGGNEGSDHLDAQGGNDRLWGGTGDDTLLGGDGNDILYGDEDNDNAHNGPLTAGRDVLDGGTGDDLLYGGGASDTIQGGDGADQIWGDSHTYFTITLDQIQGAGDTIDGGSGNDQIWGETGNDALRGALGNDRLDGGAGIDSALYSGVRRQYTATSTTVSGNGEGTDTLTSIENAVFVDGTLTFDATSASAQVMRLYSATLNRTPDQGGLEGNAAVLAGIGLTALAERFIASAEFQQRFGALSNPQFVEQLYVFALGRTGDAGGIAAWVSLLNGGMSRAQVVVGFSESAENQARTAATLAAGLWAPDAQAQVIARLYDATFDRLPDVAGLTGWTSILKGGMALRDIAASFAGSGEFQNRYGALTNQEFVEQLYRFCLDRTGDAGGVSAWTGLLNSGMTRAEVLLSFSEGAEHVALTAASWLGGIRYAGYIGSPVETTEVKGLLDAQVLPQVVDDGFAYDPADPGLTSVGKDNDAFVLPGRPDGGLTPWDLVDGGDMAPVWIDLPAPPINGRLAFVAPADAGGDFDLAAHRGGIDWHWA